MHAQELRTNRKVQQQAHEVREQAKQVPGLAAAPDRAEVTMYAEPPHDVAVPVDPSADRSQQNARRLQILRERLAAGRIDTRQGPDNGETARDADS